MFCEEKRWILDNNKKTHANVSNFKWLSPARLRTKNRQNHLRAIDGEKRSICFNSKKRDNFRLKTEGEHSI